MGILAFNKSRKQYNELLSGQVTNHRYVRLMCLAGFGSFSTITLGAYALVRNCTAYTVYPWLGWADTHFDFSYVGQDPTSVWRNGDQEAILEISRWQVILCAFTFFGFFGFAEEARRYYAIAAQSITKRVGITYTGSLGSSFFNSSGYVQMLTS
jgi:pheromone a factor receptor